MISYIPNKGNVTTEFTLAVAERILNDDVYPDSRGIIPFDKQQELAFILYNALHKIIENSVKSLIAERQSINLIVQTNDFGALFVEAYAIDGFNVPRSQLRIRVEIDTYEAKMQVFQQIHRELVKRYPAYVSHAS